MNFYEDMNKFLTTHQSSKCFAEFIPNEPRELVYYSIYSIVPEIDWVKRKVQIQVLRNNHTEAYRVAYKLSKLLDSGNNEELIYLGDRATICRPINRPTFLGFDDQKRVKYYFEVTIMSEDEE